jgi:CRP/FNR family cyclic AMP-dependent transcriptional regulator
MAGRLKVFTRDDKGRELVYNVLEPGEFFGELLLDGGTRSASVKAMLDSQCVVVHENEIRQFLRDYPEFAESLILKLIARVRHATQQVRSLALDAVYERIVTLFNDIVPFEHNARSIPITITITQQEIADRVGATREMVNHVIRDLVQGGFLRRDQDQQLVVLKKLPRKW